MADEDDDDLVRFVSWQTIDLSPSAVKDVHDVFEGSLVALDLGTKPMFLTLDSDAYPSQLLIKEVKHSSTWTSILRKSWCI